jgi:hypothetical protein
VDSPHHIYFSYDCGCLGYKQVATLRRRGDAAVQCPEHGTGRRRLSQLLLAVKAALQQACPELGPVVLDAHLLQGVQHPFDLWFPRWQIAAEVDGRQHFHGSMHNKAAAAQQRQDRRTEAACRKQRLRLLRFHRADNKQWGSLMQWAVQQVKLNPHCAFVKGTTSYAYEGITL